MNSVSMPSQPPARASSATAATTSLDTVVGAMARHTSHEPAESARCTCVWCGRELGVGHRHASVEHVVPRLKGGPAWPENEVVACRGCNRARGHVSPSSWLRECERRGLPADRPRIERKLLELHEAIA